MLGFFVCISQHKNDIQPITKFRSKRNNTLTFQISFIIVTLI